MGRKRGKRKKQNNEGYRHYESQLPEWKKIIQQAKNNGMSEPERAIVAKKASMMTAMRSFTRDLTNNLVSCNTNLGELLQTNSAVIGSLVVKGTGEGGCDEYVPIKLIVQMGEIQELDEHIQTIKSDWVFRGREEQADQQINAVLEVSPSEESAESTAA